MQTDSKLSTNVQLIGAKRGFFVSMEGIDGTGKSTQADLLQRALTLSGFSAKLVRAPGGCQLSEEIRKITKNPNINMAPETELLLMCAATGQSAQEVIKPALDAGSVVIADRFQYSTVCYQGARGLDFQFIKAAIQFSLKDVLPDLTFCLYLSEEEAQRRRTARGGTDRYEMSSQDYLSRVRKNYDWLKDQEKGSNGKIISIDAAGSIEAVHTEIYRCVAARISGLAPNQLELASKILKV